MGLFIRQDDNRSELQQRLATELQEKAKQKAMKADRPDGVDDAEFMRNTKQTNNSAWLWILVIAGILAMVVWLTIASQIG